MRLEDAQVLSCLQKKEIFDDSVTAGHCAWIRKQFLPRPSVGYHTVAVELW